MRSLIILFSFFSISAHAAPSQFAKEFGSNDRFEIVTAKTFTSKANDSYKTQFVYTKFADVNDRSCGVLTSSGPHEQIVIPAGSRLLIKKLGPFVGSKVFDDAAGADLVILNAADGKEIGLVTCGAYALWNGDLQFKLTLNMTMIGFAAQAVHPQITAVTPAQ